MKVAKAFLYRYRFLHMLWLGFPFYFTTVSFNDQRALHDYYRPAEELTDDQLLNHRARMADERPGLAARAGKAFRHLEVLYLRLTKEAGGNPERLQALLLNHTHGSYGKPDKKGRRLKVVGLARPTIDTKAMAQSLMKYAEQLNQEHREAEEDERNRKAA